ncbi:MAG: ABC transporter permease [Flavobacteriales bacterium]
MSKTRLIIKREYLTRVKKKSFILMTVLGPILFAGFFAAIVLLAMPKDKDYKILVVDETAVMLEGMQLIQLEERLKKEKSKKHSIDKVKETKKEKYQLIPGGTNRISAIKEFKKEDSEYDYMVLLPENIVSRSDMKANLYYKKAPNSPTEIKINSLINGARENLLLLKVGLNKAKYDSIKTKVGLTPLAISNIDENGLKIEDKAEFKAAAYAGFVSSILIFMFILTFGMQVMRGVIEEKTSRIIEVIISSVKPFQIMMGKIVGVGLVGLTQFIFWIILTGILVLVITPFLGLDTSPDVVAEMTSTELMKAGEGTVNEMFSMISSLPWFAMISSFLVYFLGGYLLYSSLYAGIGAAVDSETDTQQFLVPVMIPLMLGLYVAQISVMTNPEGPAMFWLSIIPFTSPVVMPIRIAMESVELWEVLLSIGVLILTFIGATWLGGKIYRTGILMYGKKVSYKELFKWLRY